MNTLLIDADILLYQTASSCENEVEFEEDIWVLWTDENEAVAKFDSMVVHLLEKIDTYSYKLCFSHAKNFRKGLYPDYKGNRPTRKPMGFRAIRERVIEENAEKVIIYPNLEADDVLGILATRDPSYVIWSIDKDLKQIPGKHLTEDGVIKVSPEEADAFFYQQILTGDATDNYKGCPGIGPVKAEGIIKLASGTGKEWSFILAAYTKAGLSEEEALVQARLARILRSSDWDDETQEVKLWTPTTA
jgi:DNA polymerase-1